MADPTMYQGWNIGAHVDFSEILKANEAVENLQKKFTRLDKPLNNAGIPNSVVKQIQHVDYLTGSFINRLESEGKTYQANELKIKAYTETVDKLTRKQVNLEKQLDRIAEANGKNSKVYKEQQIRINETVTSINQLKQKTEETERVLNKTKPSFFNKLASGSQKATKTIDSVKQHAKNALSSLKTGLFVAGGAITSVTAAAVSGAKQSATIEQRFREINNLAVLGGEKQVDVTKSIAKMQQEARDISIKYGKSQSEIAFGYEDLVKRGYTTKQALGALRTEIQASVASGDEFSDVTTVSSQVLDAFGMRAKNTASMLTNTKKVVNELAYAADATSTGFKDMGIGMSYVGAVAKQQHISLASTASAMGVLSNNGLESDKAGTGLRSTINGISNQLNKLKSGKGIFAELGITSKEMIDAKGHMKPLADTLDVLYKHIKEHSSNSVQESGFFKSIFGTTGQNAAQILASNTKELRKLTAETEKAGQGSYVQKLANRNSQTAQVQMAKMRQMTNAFKMDIGANLLPAINEAGDSLAKFLNSKDGKAFEKNVAGGVKKTADALVDLIKWSSTHKTELKFIGGAVLAGYSTVKGLEFINFLKKTKDALIDLKATSKTVKGALNFKDSLIGKSTSTGKLSFLNGALQSSRKAGGFSKLTTAGKVATVGAGIGVFANAGFDIYKGIKSKTKEGKYQGIGKGIGAGIGGGIGLWFGGPVGAAIGSKIGEVVGQWGGKAVLKFQNGWNKKKPPKNFWSLENLGWSTHDTLNKIGKWGRDVAQGIGKSLGNGKKFIKKNGKEIALSFINPIVGIPTLLYKTNPKFRKWANGVGDSIHSGWNKAIKSSHDFFANMPKNMDKFSKLVQKKWDSTWKGINSNRYVKAFKKGRLIKTGLSDIESRTRKFRQNFGKTWNDTWKSVNENRYVKAFKKGRFFSTALGDMKKGWNNFSQSFGKGWNDFWNGLIKGFSKFWDNTVGKVTGLIGKGVNNAKSFTNDVIYAFGGKRHTFKTHANGGRIGSNHVALVGEVGPELAYNPKGKARLLGANGPAIAKVYSGERILNAKDTAKVFSGGLGQGLTLKGYASGTTSLSRSNKQLDKVAKKAVNSFKFITSGVKKETKKTSTNSVKDYKGMNKSINKQMDLIKKGVVASAIGTATGFGKALGKMKGLASDAMSDTIKQLNKGITGIDKVLAQFGGNSQVIKPVHFATGSDGALTQDTLAMVNDAPSGPRQEAVVQPNGDLYIPSGKNRVLALQKGAKVLNGTQTLQLANSWGLKHFAKGSGVSNSELIKIAKRGLKDPLKAFSNSFATKIKGYKPEIERGSTSLARRASIKLGMPWMSAMWTVINNAINNGSSGRGGTREAFLKYAEKNFSNIPYVMGAMSKLASDCSGMVAMALRHFGIDIGRTTVAMQESPGVKYLGKDISKTVPGDLVIYGHGTGAAGHVGIIKDPKAHTMFNETPPYSRVTSVDSPMSMGYGYYRVRGLHDAKKRSNTSNSKLIGLAKNQLGRTAIRWIEKHLGSELGSVGSFKLGGDIADRARSLAKALKKLDPRATKAGIAAILGNWQFESQLNPTAINSSGGASGFGQWFSGRLANLKAYAKSKGKSWTNPGLQLEFALKGDGSNTAIFRRILEGKGSVASLASQFSNQWERGGHTAQHVNGARQVAQALGYKNGGSPSVGQTVKVGEDGPELAQFTKPVHIYSAEDSKKAQLNFDNFADKKKVKSEVVRSQPTININLNGPISSESDASRYGDIIVAKINELLEKAGDEFGVDLSYY